jgi:hypothetical protein
MTSGGGGVGGSANGAGGSGATGVGGATSGGGGVGGSANGAAGGGGTTGGACKTCATGQECNASGACVCDATSCPSGCCSSGTCVTTETVSACGITGATCKACSSGQACSGGACVCNATSCPNGCCDSSGQCHTSSSSSCGVGGAACKTCASGQECNGSGACVCDAASCPNGCCNGSTCLPYASETNTLCGTGGAACAACASGISCNTTGGICLGCLAPAVITYDSIPGAPAGNGNDQFGDVLALRAGMLMVSSTGNASGVGTVYTFSGSGSSYTFGQAINGGSVSGSTNFGNRVALDSTGTMAVIDSFGQGVGYTLSEVLTKSGANWFPGVSIMLPSNDNFASAAAVDNGTVVISGSYGAYVYGTSGGTPQTLEPSDFTPMSPLTGSVAGYFGYAIALSGNTLLVLGEPIDASGLLGHFGYVFVRSGSAWTQQAKLVPSDLADTSSGSFNFSIALDGTTAALASTNGVYVFTQSGSTWTQVQKLVPPSGAPAFGMSVSLSGNTMVVGGYDVDVSKGAVYVYGRSNGTWIAGPVLTSGAQTDFYAYGPSVAVSQGTVAVGAAFAGSDDNGAAYLYACQPSQ